MKKKFYVKNAWLRGVCKMKKTVLPHTCFVCNAKLWFSDKNRNYRYYEVSRKGYYICHNCSVKDIKQKLVKEKPR